jgi:uncharacterized membrane protein
VGLAFKISSTAFSGVFVITCIAVLAALGAATIALWAAEAFLKPNKNKIAIFFALIFGWYLASGFALKQPDYLSILISIIAGGIIFFRRRHLPNDGQHPSSGK